MASAQDDLHGRLGSYCGSRSGQAPPTTHQLLVTAGSLGTQIPAPQKKALRSPGAPSRISFRVCCLGSCMTRRTWRVSGLKQPSRYSGFGSVVCFVFFHPDLQVSRADSYTSFTCKCVLCVAVSVALVVLLVICSVGLPAPCLPKAHRHREAACYWGAAVGALGEVLCPCHSKWGESFPQEKKTPTGKVLLSCFGGN